MKTVDVLLTGKTLPGADQERAAAALAKMAGIPQDKALEFLSSGQPKLARRSLSPEAGQLMVEKLASLGIAASLRAAGGDTSPAPAPEPKPAQAQAQAPKAAPAPLLAPEEPEPFNPYAAPKANLHKKSPHPSPSGSVEWRETGRTVPVSHGLSWFSSACKLFMAHPGACLVSAAPFFGVMLAVTILPIFFKSSSTATIAMNVMAPLFAGVFCARAHQLNTGEEMPLLVKGKDSDKTLVTRRLINVGILCTLYQIVLAIPGVIIFIIFTKKSGVNVTSILPLALIGTILASPLYLVALFSPSLVALSDDSAIASIKRAIRAGFASKGALLLNVLCMVFLFMLCLGVPGGAMDLMNSALSDSEIVLNALVALGFSIFWIIFTLASYMASRDVFSGEDDCR